MNPTTKPLPGGVNDDCQLDKPSAVNCCNHCPSEEDSQCDDDPTEIEAEKDFRA